jgi:hypothetical protein
MSSSLGFVARVQSADFGEGDNLAVARRLNPAWLGSIFVQPQTGAPAVIVGELTFQHEV